MSKHTIYYNMHICFGPRSEGVSRKSGHQIHGAKQISTAHIFGPGRNLKNARIRRVLLLRNKKVTDAKKGSERAQMLEPPQVRLVQDIDFN